MVKTSEMMRQDVMDELAWDGAIDGAGIGVFAAGGAVTLTGHVRSYAEKRAAEKAAKRVSGVLAVANELEVRVPGSMKRDDTDIAGAVGNALAWNVSVPEGVSAVVDQGWVTLDGEAEMAFQRRAAENAVRDIIGVRGVTNLIRVAARPLPRDAADQIRRAFQRSAQIDAEHILVEVVDDRVVLSGTARNWSERNEAEHAARAAAGARDVENRLRVRTPLTVLT